MVVFKFALYVPSIIFFKNNTNQVEEKMKVNHFEWQNKKVLITGASGFKGSWLCAVLLRLGAEVYGTTRHQLNPISAYSILELDKHIIQLSVDISERQQVYDAINSIKPDVIFHLAAKALVPVSLRDPRRTFEVNVMGTLNIIEACRRLKVCNRMVVCSTDHVFGKTVPSEFPINGFTETSRVSYGGPYDTSKSAMELAVRSYYYTYWNELPAIGITRCANVFGYGDMNQRRVIPLFVNEAIHNGEIPLLYLMNGRQFIHITDAIVGYIRAASILNDGDINSKQGKDRPEDRSPFTPTFHFAIEKYDHSQHPYITMESLAQIVASIYGAKVNKEKAVKYAPNENKIQALNCEKTRSDLNWEIKKPLDIAIRDLGDWYKNIDNHTILKELIEKDVNSIVQNLSDI